jgi:hypothetical protein
MVPPVQRMQLSHHTSYRTLFLPSSQFGIPWTGGNPKLVPINAWLPGKFGIPWTGGNPKHFAGETASRARAVGALAGCFTYEPPPGVAWNGGDGLSLKKRV